MSAPAQAKPKGQSDGLFKPKSSPAFRAQRGRSAQKPPSLLGFPLFLAFIGILVASTSFPAQTSPRPLSSSLGPPGRALLLTAHPDDEVMFFSPTIMGLQSAGWDVSGLCLSTGNFEGLGETRRHELTASYETFGVKRDKVMVIDHPLLQDDMTTRWSPNIIGAVVDSYLAERDFGLIITFDRHGISNHPNHASLSTYRSNTTAIYHLVSPSILTKYTGPLLRIIPTRLSSTLQDLLGSIPLLGGVLGHEQVAITLETNLQGWQTGVRAMRQHRTQLVWFRWLYLVSSRLMWVNQLVRAE